MVHDVYNQNAPDLEYGYNLVTIIPSGATSINVTQLRSGRNYLGTCYILFVTVSFIRHR